jgi:hypothetical protein
MPNFAPSPNLSPEDIPKQLRLLGSNTLADLIERAGLSDALKARGPFTVFAPTDEAFERFIGERGDEYKNVILSDRVLLQNILLQHVAPNKLRSNELSDGMSKIFINILFKNVFQNPQILKQTVMFSFQHSTIVFPFCY